MKTKKIFITLLIAATAILIILQFIRPEIPAKPVTGDLQAPPDVKAIFKRACYNCHSNETNLSWFDKISPIYWQVAAHVNAGRAGLNFSEWDRLSPGDRKAKLWEAVNQIASGVMPLKEYEFVHGESEISPQDLAVLENYLIGMVKDKPADTTAVNALLKQQSQEKTAAKMAKLPVSLNGITYMPDYKNWHAISSTERMDNGTMRVIYGNDIAEKAIHSGSVNPWPDGTIFAKVTWEQLEDRNGNVTTGAFLQIEYMIKDRERFKSTHGWGFARFKTLKMIPYGKTVLFANECMNCHSPQADRDFVFTSPLNN